AKLGMRKSRNVTKRKNLSSIQVNQYVKFFINEIRNHCALGSHLKVKILSAEKIQSILCKLVMRQLLFVNITKSEHFFMKPAHFLNIVFYSFIILFLCGIV